jgi:hypothetical protein
MTLKYRRHNDRLKEREFAWGRVRSHAKSFQEDQLQSASAMAKIPECNGSRPR